MFRALAASFQDESGTTAVEYAVMLALILLAVIAGVGSLGSSNSTSWQQSFSRIVEILT